MAFIKMEYEFSFFHVLIPLLLLIYIWKTSKTKDISTPNLPPGPWRLPIIGNLHHLLYSLPHHRLRDLAMKYGSLMHLQLGQISTVVISSPEFAKEIMKTHDIVFADRPFHIATDTIFYNSRDLGFAPYGDYWRQLKKICTLKLLSAKRVQSFRSVREEEVSNLIKSISSNEGLPVNLSEKLMSLSNCLISRTAFGTSGEQESAFTPLIQRIGDAVGGFSIADVFPSFKLLHIITGMRTKIQRLHHDVDMVLEKIITERRTSMQTEKLGSKVETCTLVDILLNLQDHGALELPLTTEGIKGVILDMFLGGTDTITSTAEWAMSEMLKNPRVMETAQAEVRQVFGGREKIDATNSHGLRHLKLVIKETLRLHPPLPLLIPREARERAEINGFEIPEKTQVIINAWAIGRDPHYWKESEKFCPERFIDSPIDYKGTDFELIPFGAGRRICPGILYGMAVVELLLASLLYHFDWKLPDGMKQEDLDMSEISGAGARRKYDLYLIPTLLKPVESEVPS